VTGVQTCALPISPVDGTFLLPAPVESGIGGIGDLFEEPESIKLKVLEVGEVLELVGGGG
jgi:hypothetical protein